MLKKNPVYKYESEPSDLQYKTINFLNKQQFVINNDMLNYLLKEWELENSVLFEGYNKCYRDNPNIKEFF